MNGQRNMCGLGMFAVVTCAAIVNVGASDYDEQFLAGLRSRRLFVLATAYCRQELQKPVPSPEAQAEWTIELIRTLAEQALHAPRSQRDAVWQELAAVVSDFQMLGPEFPKRPLVQFHAALAQLAKGDLLRRESEVASSTAETQMRAGALDAIREATRGLEDVARDLQRRIPLARDVAAGNAEGRLTADELRSLQNQVQVQLGRAYRLRGEAYPAGSDDRIAALSAALEQLKEPLSRLPQHDPLVTKIRINQAICFRLLKNYEQAEQVVMTLQDPAAPPLVRLQGRAERIRLKLAEDRVEGTLPLLRIGREVDGVTAPELDLAWLEAFTALWERAKQQGDEAAASQWREQSLALSRSMEANYGTYWGRMADRVLVSHAGANPNRQDLELLRRQADAIYLKGEPDEAVQAYDTAFEVALDAEQPDEAFELAYKGALVRLKQGRQEDYRRRLQQLAIQLPNHPQSPAAHMQAIQMTIEAARSDAQKIDTYHQLLVEHLEIFPEATTADRVRLWLGRLYQSRKQWADAAAAFTAVAPASADWSDAVQGAGHAYLAWITTIPELGQNDQAGQDRPEDPEHQAKQVLDQAVDFFRRALTTSTDDDVSTVGSTISQRRAVVALARLAIVSPGLNDPDLLRQVERYLVAALRNEGQEEERQEEEHVEEEGDPPAEKTWRATATSLLVVVLAAQEGRQQEAVATLRAAMHPPGLTLESRLEILDGLGRITPQRESRRVRELAEIQVAATDALWGSREKLTPPQQRRLAELRGKALAASGQPKQAIDVLTELVNQFPRDAAAHVALATLQVESDQDATVRKGLEHWRLIAHRSRPGTTRWYRAKYYVAFAMARLGQTREANQLIRYVDATAGLENTPMAAEFRELMRATD